MGDLRGFWKPAPGEPQWISKHEKKKAKAQKKKAKAERRHQQKRKFVPRKKQSEWRLKSKEFYASYAWLKARYEALKTHGARCQCCGITPADGAVMNVDHIKPRYRFPELELDINNLQVLCARCNQGKGAWDNTDWRARDLGGQLDREFKAIIG